MPAFVTYAFYGGGYPGVPGPGYGDDEVGGTTGGASVGRSVEVGEGVAPMAAVSEAAGV
jgi:hypothetical protein